MVRRGGSRWIPQFRHPAQYVVFAFVSASVVGAVLLWLPFASEDPGSTTPVTALFTSTSAVCVTGLGVVDTAGHFSLFGELVILGLIQVGGFGIMTMSSLLVLVLARRLGLRHRLVAVAETGTFEMADIRRLVLAVAKLSVAVESVAAVLLFLRFWQTHGEPAGRAAYWGVFHSISAFNNAGFSLFSDSLVGYADDSTLLLIVAAAIVIGGLGFPVWLQIAESPRSPRNWDLHTKLTVSTTIGLILVGWALFAWFEWTNTATLGPSTINDSVTNALFQSITPRTAGFNALPVDALREPSRLLTEVFMIIGGGSASTAGGIKVTTFALLGWVMWAEVRGDPDVVVFDRRIPAGAQRQALTVALFAIGVVIVATLILLATTPLGRDNVLFESISALGTVGLSSGITPLLTIPSQLLVILLMLLGRVGPITLFVALVLREKDRRFRLPEERPIVG